jgi:hypothetical protein
MIVLMDNIKYLKVKYLLLSKSIGLDVSFIIFKLEWVIRHFDQLSCNPLQGSMMIKSVILRINSTCCPIKINCLVLIKSQLSCKQPLKRQVRLYAIWISKDKSVSVIMNSFVQQLPFTRMMAKHVNLFFKYTRQVKRWMRVVLISFSVLFFVT